MSTPIDDALAELLSDLGEGWSVLRISADSIDVSTYSDQGAAFQLPGQVEAIIGHTSGIQSLGRAFTVGNALARAVTNLLDQEGRALAQRK